MPQRRRRCCRFQARQKRDTNDPSQIEFLAQQQDTVLEEEVALRRVRRLRLGHGETNYDDSSWRNIILSFLNVLDDWRASRKRRHGIRRRRERHAKMRADMDRRLRVPAFVCHLPSDLLR